MFESPVGKEEPPPPPPAQTPTLVPPPVLRQTQSGPAQHDDLWTQVLDLLDTIGAEVQWLRIPSHIGIRGNERADNLADEGRRKSPLLQGLISVGPAEAEHESDDPSPPPNPWRCFTVSYLKQTSPCPPPPPTPKAPRSEHRTCRKVH